MARARTLLITICVVSFGLRCRLMLRFIQFVVVVVAAEFSVLTTVDSAYCCRIQRVVAVVGKRFVACCCCCSLLHLHSFVIRDTNNCTQRNAFTHTHTRTERHVMPYFTVMSLSLENPISPQFRFMQIFVFCFFFIKTSLLFSSTELFLFCLFLFVVGVKQSLNF